MKTGVGKRGGDEGERRGTSGEEGKMEGGLKFSSFPGVWGGSAGAGVGILGGWSRRFIF